MKIRFAAVKENRMQANTLIVCRNNYEINIRLLYILSIASDIHVPCVPEIVFSVRDIINRVIHKLEYRTRDHLKAEIWRK